MFQHDACDMSLVTMTLPSLDPKIFFVRTLSLGLPLCIKNLSSRKVFCRQRWQASMKPEPPALKVMEEVLRPPKVLACGISFTPYRCREESSLRV